MRQHAEDRPLAGALLRTLVPVALAAAGLTVASAAPRGGAVFMISTCAVAAVYGIAWVLWGQPRDTFRRDRLVRDAVRGLVTGLALVGMFAVGALLVREMPLLAAPVEDLLAHASEGRLVPVAIITSVSGIAEELFYRRTAVITLPGGSRTRVLGALLLFMAVSATMGVPLLVVAAAVLGIVAAAEARRTRSLTSPIVLHVVWSLSMLLVLPTLLGASGQTPR